MRIKKYFLHALSILALIFQSVQLKAQGYSCQHMKNAVASPSLYYNAENKRSDTIDIVKYTINLEIGNSVNKLIQGNTVVRFAPKINNRTYIRLDLLKLTIDSIKENTTPLLYSYNDTLLKINFAGVKNTIDTSNITIYYKGQPQADQTWGGFLFENGAGAEYAYNLGVAFTSKPHNFGRVWFPCFDNFVERSKYEFNITCDSARRAYCNGQLMSDVLNGPKRTRQWILNEQIPTYLASVAVAKYRQVNWTVNTLTGVKPITLVAITGDTAAMKAGFINLKNCINGFESYYGPYRWNRFGYCSVPFNGGAMEHATNISYPKATLGNLAYEANLMAHELSHHWWGDNLTCETPEDMWINEGMASYSEYMFTEYIYGPAQYLSAVKNQHVGLVQFLFKQEGGFRAVSGIPHNLTYGSHVYKKGAEVAHNLRTYMGDAAFFTGIKYAMQQNQFKSVNSLELRDLLQTSSGQNLVDFFNNWILAGGWPHFAIDSVKYIQVGATYNAIVSIKQKLCGAPNLYNNVPLELSFFKNDWSRVIQKVIMSGATSTFTINIPYNAAYCALNYDTKITDATSFENKTIKTVTNVGWNLGKLFTQIQNSGADSSLIRVIHNHVKPDPFKNNPQNHKLSDQHFWKVEGLLSPGFHSKARFSYDGNKIPGGTYSVLDTLLTIVNGDSVRLFFRANAADDWKLCMNIFKFESGAKTGFIEIDTLKLGEYTFGNSTDTTNIIFVKENFNNKVSVKIFPNPAKQSFKIAFDKTPEKTYTLNVLDMEGRLIFETRVNEKINSININDYAKGTYIIKLETGNRVVYCDKLIVE